MRKKLKREHNRAQSVRISKSLHVNNWKSRREEENETKERCEEITGDL